ncbi:MAG TPA: NADH-quinone oxidoreductase subunit H [Candidatus Aquicultor sp.]|jgi:formate hydrogenlyase subunit 4
MELLSTKIAVVLGHALFVVLIAPLFTALMKKVKAYFQCRRGPGLLQGYYDIWKLLKKDAVVSEHASWVFKAAPYIIFSATFTAAMIVPSFIAVLPTSAFGDAIVVIYLLGLARFFTALAGLDTGSSFGGMGSSREMMISSLAEPVTMTGIFVLAADVGSTNFSDIVAKSLSMGYAQPAYILLALAFLIIAMAETSRIPVDNPATHLELTMVHEAMILEYTGRDLALIEWAGAMKLTLLLTIIANVFFPWGIAQSISRPAIVIGITAITIKLILLAVGIATIESSIAKLRLFRVPELIGGAFALAMLALIIKVTGLG